jgi:PAS domain-containing protein
LQGGIVNTGSAPTTHRRDFGRRIQALRQRAEELQRLATTPVPQLAELLLETLQELADTLAELQAAEQERRRQDEELAAARQAAEALRQSEQRFHSPLQTAGSVILYLSPDHRILEWNPEAERIYG